MAEWPVKINLDVKVSEKTADKIAGALLDLVSPVTQPTGLLGDYIAHRRKVLSVILERGLEQARKSKRDISPPPPKFLLDFADKASREDLDSELVGAWANLLAEAATNYDFELNSYAEILSKLSSLDASILTEIGGKLLHDHAQYMRFSNPSLDFEDFPAREYESRTIIDTAREADKIAQGVVRLRKPGPRQVIRAMVPHKESGVSVGDGEVAGKGYRIALSEKYGSHPTSFDVLKRMGLIEYIKHMGEAKTEGGGIIVLVYWDAELTALGAEFLLSCQGKRDQQRR